MATPHNQRQPKCNHEVLAKMTTFLSFDVGLHWATLVLGAIRTLAVPGSMGVSTGLHSVMLNSVNISSMYAA